METRTKEIYEVLGFKIAYITVLKDDEVIEAHYNILNNLGEIVSRDYPNVLEPLNLLLNVKKQMSDDSESEYPDEIFSSSKKETPVTQGVTGDR